MAASTSPAAPESWRAEDAVYSIFEFDENEQLQRLDPARTTCLALVDSGDRRCTFFDKMQKETTRREERGMLVDSFLVDTRRQDPTSFKAAVMRFIELAVCHRYHVHKMIDAAERWFEEHALTTASRVPAEGILMRQYIKGRDERQLERLIKEPLEKVEYREGQVYITVSSDVPGYIKIGYTSTSLDERFERARKDCSINIKLVYATGRLPHAKRLESIVHNELADKRYRFADPCSSCLTKAKRHEEWFLTTVEYARGVAEHWKDFLVQGMYDQKKKILAVIRCDEILLSASPEYIKERERRLSPEPAGVVPQTDSSSQVNPPDSPTPAKKDTSQRLFHTTRVLRSTPSLAKGVKPDVVEDPTGPLPSSKAANSNSNRIGALSALPRRKVSVEGTDSADDARDGDSSYDAAQATTVTKSSPVTQATKNSAQHERSTEDCHTIPSPKDDGINMKSLVESLKTTKKARAEPTASGQKTSTIRKQLPIR